jgi:hypothetical protein
MRFERSTWLIWTLDSDSETNFYATSIYIFIHIVGCFDQFFHKLLIELNTWDGFTYFIDVLLDTKNIF